MREGSYELRAYLRASDERLEERVIKGVNYFVAVPGEEYYLKVFVHRGENGEFPAKYLRIAAYIDGIDVNYWKRLDMSNEKNHPKDPDEGYSATFWGFKRNDSVVQAFAFASAKSDSAMNSDSSQNDKLGHIKVDIFEAEVSEGSISNRSGCHEVPNQKSSLSTSQKFWAQASVTTVGGRSLTNKERFAPIPRWTNKPHPVTGDPDTPVLSMEARYHSELLCQTLQDIFAPDDEDEDEKEDDVAKEKKCSSSASNNESAGNRKRLDIEPSSVFRPRKVQLVDLSQDSGGEDGDASSPLSARESIVGSLEGGSSGYVSVVRDVLLVDMSAADEEGDLGVDRVVQEREEKFMANIDDGDA